MPVVPARNLTLSQTQPHSYGLLITAVTLLVIELLSRTVFRVPTPGAILLVPIAYAAFTGGLRGGLASATLIMLYWLYFFALPDQFLQYTDGSLQSIIVLVLVAMTMVFMIGSLKQRIEQLSYRNQLILHSAGEGICGVDTQGKITFLNPAVAEMCGWTVAELIGQPIHALMQWPYPEQDRAVAAGTPSDAPLPDWSLMMEGDSLFWRKDGSQFPAEYTSSPILEHHKLAGAVITFRDISERQRVETELREREASFRLLFANNPLPMWVFDRDTQAFLEVNTTAIAHYGYTQEEFLRMHISDIRPLEDVAYMQTQLAVLSPKLTVSGPWRHSLKDGRVIMVITHVHMLVLAKRQAVLVVVEDITERQAAEVALQQLNAELELRVVERTAQLETINKELETFSYSVSHDLRAPLRSIDGFSQTLLEDYSHQLDTIGQGYLQRVRAATQRMAQLIDDLLGLARVTRSELHHDRVDLSAHAATIAADLRQTQPDRQVTFEIAPDLVVHGDERLLHLVLENLLANAWKFTSKREHSWIEFGMLPYEGQLAYFVRDNGAGFDMAYADKLFGAFQRLHTMSEFTGTGIGLATVQRVIHRHGGRVWAEGAVDQGATFFFTLQQEVSHQWGTK